MAFQIFNFVIGLNLTEIHKYVLEKYVMPLFGAVRGDPRYNPKVDINGDGKIDMTDIAAFARDPSLTFQTFGVTPVLWWQIAVPVGVVAVGGVAAYLWLKKKR